MKSECYCQGKEGGHSCESSTQAGKRFCFNKNEFGWIVGGGMTTPDIPTCRAKHEGEWSDKPLKTPQVDEPVETLNHKERRKQRRHKK